MKAKNHKMNPLSLLTLLKVLFKLYNARKFGVYCCVATNDPIIYDIPIRFPAATRERVSSAPTRVGKPFLHMGCCDGIVDNAAARAKGPLNISQKRDAYLCVVDQYKLAEAFNFDDTSI